MSQKVVYKYPLKYKGQREPIEMPVGAEIIAIQKQLGAICVWAIVDMGQPNKEMRYIEIYGTGHPFDNAGPRKYITTLQEANGSLIWHFFEYSGL